MSRKRNISTDISTDTRVAALAEKAGPFAVLAFTWLIPHADDWGRFTADPMEIKLQVFPAFNVTTHEIQEALQAIAEVGLITLYQVNGKQYLAFRNSFYKYQTYIPATKRREDKSQYPAPPNINEHRIMPQNATDYNSVPQSAIERREMPLSGPSPSPSPSETNVDLDTEIITPGDDKESRGVQGGENPPSPAASAVTDQPPHKECNKFAKNKVQEAYTAEFEHFWAIYPRKLEKRAAYKSWRARLKEGIKPDDLIIAALNYAKYCRQNGIDERFIKHAATFLGPSRSYEDYLSSSKARAEPGQDTGIPLRASPDAIEPKAWDTLRQLARGDEYP
ncbi:hypothetical protein SDD30_08160 [Moorella naiadis]|uniref:hypothetical protein n=1 Tax=Moorella naiadis (nom. illeg.) TaxID=3093670 RepID=UPI003D9C9935